MDFLTDWLTNWLKELLIGGIMGNLEGLFDTVNTQVGEIAAQVGTTPAAWHAGVFSLIRQLSETVILPIAGMVLTFVATYELIQMLLEKNNMHEVDVANLYKWMFKTACAILILSNTFNIVMAVFDVSQSVIAQAGGLIQGSKGAGDIICCLDESGSTAGDLAAWGKAVALTLLEIAQSEGRKFALVHFSGPGRFQTDVFLPRQSSLEEKLRASETFLGGGTDFQTPLAEAERLMREGGFENADIAFITDGECSLPETCVEMLQKAQSELRFTVTGILLDEGNAGMDFSLKPFCQNIYRTSELTGDQIVEEIVLDRV